MGDISVTADGRVVLAQDTPPNPRYLELLPRLRQAAYFCGYALGAHGSMSRDLDVIAAPWTDDARGPIVLIEALADSCPGYVEKWKPTIKPQGRLAWIIRVGSHLYVDVSVIPRALDGC